MRAVTMKSVHNRDEARQSPETTPGRQSDPNVKRTLGHVGPTMGGVVTHYKLLNSMKHYGLNPPDIICQQDNDPKHTSKKVKEWLGEQKFRTMVWPAQSPDLNLIEHLWGYLKRRLAEHENPPSGIHELWERVQMDWEEIAASECQKLIQSMPRRVQAVLKAKGGYTKY